MQIPAALTAEAKAVLESAQRIAIGFGHVVVDPEHVVQALIAGDEAANLLVTDLGHWQKADLARRFRILPTAEGVVDPTTSSRLNQAISDAIAMGGEVHHLASAAIESQKASDERMAEEQRRYEDEHNAQEALAHARKVTAKKVSLNYTFDAETGAHVVDLKIEAGPGFAESASGPHAIRNETTHAVLELVGRSLGAQKHPPDMEADGDGEYLGSLNGSIFD